MVRIGFWSLFSIPAYDKWAIDYALKNAEKHCKWAKRVNEKITKSIKKTKPRAK